MNFVPIGNGTLCPQIWWIRSGREGDSYIAMSAYAIYINSSVLNVLIPYGSQFS